MTNSMTKSDRRVIYPTQVIPRRLLPYLTRINSELFYVRASLLAGLFPDELLVKEKSVTVVHNSFLFSYDETLTIKDIGRVICMKTPFLAGLRIYGKNPTHILEITGLWNNAAVRGKELIEGLLLAESDIGQTARKIAAETQTVLPEHTVPELEDPDLLQSDGVQDKW